MRVGEDYKSRKKENVEFESINFMRECLEMPLLEKGWVKCIGGCSDEFYSFDKKGNRMCECCKTKPRNNTYNNFEDAYALVGV